MAKINTSGIEGYEGMTAEQKLTAVLGMEVPEAVDLSKYVPKEAFDRKASEAAALSQQLRGKQTDEEAAAAEAQRAQRERDEKYAELEEKYNTLMRTSTINEYAAKFQGLGFDEKDARRAGESLADGKAGDLFPILAAWGEALKKKYSSETMSKNPPPGGANGAANGSDPWEDAAKRIGQARAAERKAAQDVWKHYET